MKKEKFLQAASEAGFSDEMAEFLWHNLSTKPHTHTAAQILDFDEAVTAVVEEAEIEDEDEDESEDERV